MITYHTKDALKMVLAAFTSTVFSVIVVVCALYAGGIVFESTKGHNYSDVGVPMYTNGGGAALLGLFTYLGIIVVVPVITWELSRSKIFLYAYGVVTFFSLIPILLLFVMIAS